MPLSNIGNPGGSPGGGGGGITQVDRVYLQELTPLNPASANQDIGLSIEIPEAGDYTIEVYLAGGCIATGDGTTTFLAQLVDDADDSLIDHGTGVFCTGPIANGDTVFDDTFFTTDITATEPMTIKLTLANASSATLDTLIIYGDPGNGGQPATSMKLLKHA